uniref:Transthyretin-like family protein n=1 Tax=Plectus sambesii TaxID=2011161 RepID=A0A914WD47_9BILA
MKFLIVFVVCALFGYNHALKLFGRTQSVGAKGTLMCGSEPLANTIVKLWDDDTIDMDDQMACVRTDAQGNFEIKGWEKEFTTIDPYLKVYHDCNDKTLFGLVEK